jgi:outer membrane lipoprotein-sorting protein
MVSFMNRFSPRQFFLFTILVALFVSSCSTSRRTIREPLKEQGTDFLFNNLKANELNYQNFSARFSAKFIQNKNETQITGQIRIKRDSLIWISVSPLMGIEMARFLVSNDSIWYVNRMEKTYFSGSFDHINRLINSTLDYDMLQSFLTGNDFSRYENTSFKGDVDNMEYKLATTDRRKLKKFAKDNSEINIPIQHIWLNPDNFKISRIMVREVTPNGRKAEAKYSHENIDGQFVPVNIIFDVETIDKKTSIDINYSKITMSDSLNFPFKIPENYARLNNL